MRRRGLRRVPPKRWRASWCSFASLLESRPAVGYRSAARDHSTHDGATEYLLARERLVKKLGRVRPSSKPATNSLHYHASNLPAPSAQGPSARRVHWLSSGSG